jgi:hypothetical protein
VTTIVYRDGILAGDTGVGRDGSFMPEKQRKVFRLRNGRLLAWCGDISRLFVVHKLLNDPKEPALPESDGGSGILIEPDGRVATIEQGIIVPVYGAPYVAMGSGRDFAYGALAMGASAIEAVRVAARFDKHTRLPLRWIKL